MLGAAASPALCSCFPARFLRRKRRRGDYKPCRVQNGTSFCIIGAPPRLTAASPPYKIAVLYNRPSGRAVLLSVSRAAAAA